jgi:hypothetical protein
MPNFLEDFMSSMGPEVAKKLGSSLNVDQGTIQKIIPLVAPMILSGLKNQKDNFGGEQRVDHILNKYGSADVLQNLDQLFSKKMNDPKADPKLGGLLGDAGTQAANLISKNFNLDSSTAMKLIPMLAPVILGFLTNKRDSQGAGSSGIASLLDQNGDGSILDDVAGFILNQATGQKSGNLLTNLLGSLFGKKN